MTSLGVLAAALAALAMQALPVQGIVVKKGSTEPLSKATVELRRDQQNAGILQSITTGDDGRFSFGNVAPGRYRVAVTRRGYTRPPLAITVAPGQAAADIQLNMTQTGSISGRVVDASGRPMGGIEIKAMKASYGEGRRILTPVASVLTNDLGEYRLFWLAPGRYYVAAVHPKAQSIARRMAASGLVTTANGTQAVFIAAGNGDPAILTLNPMLESQSETERYAPIFFGGTTDEQTASGIDLREAAEFTGVNFVVAPVQIRHVRGVVVDGATGRPAKYGSITLAKDIDAPPMKDVKVDSDTGRFDMLLFPGSYTLTSQSASGEGYSTFTLGDADIENLTIPTTMTFELKGRIAIEGSTVGANALETLRLNLRREPPRGEPAMAAYDTPMPDGTFTIFTSAGDYRINIAPILNVIRPRFGASATGALQNAYVKSIRLGNVDVLNGTLHLDGPPAATLEVVIATNAGRLQGQTEADAVVALLPDNRRRNELYQTTTADASGRFHFDRVPPGEYKLFSWSEVDDGAWFDAEFMKGVESRGMPIHIGEGETKTARVDDR
jgi:protocatechuate 3,4-dioxygenase beta subunit